MLWQSSCSSNLESIGGYTNDRVVSSVILGFWTYLFTKVPFLRGGQSLLKVFPEKDYGIGQKTIYKELQAIKAFRNRIAHHEAICFDKSGSINTSFAKSNFDLLIKYVKFMGYPEKELYYGLDVLPNRLILKIMDKAISEE